MHALHHRVDRGDGHPAAHDHHGCVVARPAHHPPAAGPQRPLDRGYQLEFGHQSGTAITSIQAHSARVATISLRSSARAASGSSQRMYQGTSHAEATSSASVAQPAMRTGSAPRQVRSRSQTRLIAKAAPYTTLTGER